MKRNSAGLINVCLHYSRVDREADWYNYNCNLVKCDLSVAELNGRQNEGLRPGNSC